MPRSHYGRPGNTVTGQRRRAVIADIRAGQLGRNAIAKKHGLSGSTVSGIAKAEGLEFAGRSKVAAATKARTIDNKSRRSALSARLLEEADGLLDEMHREFLAFNIGGKDNVYTEHTLPRAPTGDKRNLMLAATAALQRHLDLERHDADEKAADARSMLAELGKALGVQQPDA